MGFPRALRSALACTAGIAALAAVAPACAPIEEESSDATDEPSSDLLARESGFGADPDYVVRQRVVFGQESGDVVRFERQPFSHRARKWHVFPMTVYPDARIGFRLQVEDRQMAQIAEVRLYGPALSDGAFPKAQTIATDEHGQAEIKQSTLQPGRYVVVVGPRDKSEFLPRYPGNVVSLKVPGKTDPVDFKLTLGDDGWTAEGNGATYRVVGPAPDALKQGASLRLAAKSDGANDLEAKIADFSSHELYVPSSGDENQRLLGVIDRDELVLDMPTGTQRMLIQQAAHVGKAPEPILLQVLPQRIAKDAPVPLDARGAALDVLDDADCKGDECRVPVYADDHARACAAPPATPCLSGYVCIGGKCEKPVPSPVLEAVAESYKPLFIDPSEPSTYSLEISCADHCMPTPVDHAHMTKYPVYFAHGFNSNRDTWKAILAWLAQVPGFRDHASAESVPGFEPTDVRADRLRQKLAAFIRTMEEGAPLPNGETMRVNVIGHSMGGLDARLLISSPKYNEQCSELACEDEVDTSGKRQKVSCCAPSDKNGKPTMWRDRIASLTTLSTPHLGSSFASWGLGQLNDGTFGSTFRLVAERFFGLDDGGYDGVTKTLSSLSLEEGQARDAALAPPNPARTYSWACATGSETCTMPPGIDAPPKSADGKFQLPPPNDKPTIFSWAGMACATGGCGNVLDPMLLLPYSVLVAAGEKKNDGVVGVDHARYGIYMGTMPADHFDWTRTDKTAGTAKRTLEWAFGIKNEPIERFHQTWIERLAQAGY